MTPKLVLLLLAMVCFVCAAANVPARGANLTALGLALFILSMLL